VRCKQITLERALRIEPCGIHSAALLVRRKFQQSRALRVSGAPNASGHLPPPNHTRSGSFQTASGRRSGAVGWLGRPSLYGQLLLYLGLNFLQRNTPSAL
jgi:hypothetical protein